MTDIIDINVYETVETVAITVEPNLTTINVNSITGGLVSSVNGQVGDVIIGVSDNNFTNTLKTKLDGIAAGAEVNVNADWNATSGDAQILNKPTIPTQTSQLTNNGADGTNPFITALDVPIYGQAGLLVREVRNTTGATLTKGTVVYINGANGNKPTVAKALATTDALSARTFGLLQTDLANNTNGYVVVIGDLSNLNTSAFTEGAQLYLSGTVAGTYTATKTLAPTHLVYIGKVTRAHPTQGQIEVQIQNGYELEEIHDVAIVSPINNNILTYETSTDLWKNKTITEVLGYTPPKIVIKDTARYTLTGTVANTIVSSYLINANTFSADDFFRIASLQSTKTGTTAWVIRCYLNSTISLSGAIQIATVTTSLAQQYTQLSRNLFLRGGNILGFPFTATINNDIINSSGAISSATFNPANQIYFIVAIQPSLSTDTCTQESLLITN